MGENPQEYLDKLQRHVREGYRVEENNNVILQPGETGYSENFDRCVAVIIQGKDNSVSFSHLSPGRSYEETEAQYLYSNSGDKMWTVAKKREVALTKASDCKPSPTRYTELPDNPSLTIGIVDTTEKHIIKVIVPMNGEPTIEAFTHIGSPLSISFERIDEFPKGLFE